MDDGADDEETDALLVTAAEEIHAIAEHLERIEEEHGRDCRHRWAADASGIHHWRCRHAVRGGSRRDGLRMRR